MKEKTHLGNRLLSVLLTFLMLLSLLPSAALAADTQQIALMAVTQNGFLIEPEYVTYHSGDTVKDVLKKSSHTFSGHRQRIHYRCRWHHRQLQHPLRRGWIQAGSVGGWPDGHLVHHQLEPEPWSKPPEAGGQHGGLQHRYQRPEGLQGRSGGL